MLRELLLYNTMNQLYIPSLLNLPSPSQPSCHHRALSWAPRAIQHLPTSHLFYTQWVYGSVLLSRFISPSPSPLCIHMKNVEWSMSAFLFLPWKYIDLYPFSRFHICALIYNYLFFIFWLTSFCMTDSRSIHVTANDPVLFLFYGWVAFHCQRRQWHPTPALLPGKSHGRRSLVGCSPWGR